MCAVDSIEVKVLELQMADLLGAKCILPGLIPEHKSKP